MKMFITLWFLMMVAIILILYFTGAAWDILAFSAAGTRAIRQLDTQSGNAFGNFV